ncbi:MAG: hypothetical protein WC503_04080 [Candidatus Shapirobacteria bacterium]
MSVSDKTAKEMIGKIITWAEMSNLPMFSVISLIDILSTVPGNKSFKDTMVKLKSGLVEDNKKRLN